MARKDVGAPETLLNGDELVLVVDGPGVTPDSVSATSFVELASAFLDLVMQSAEGDTLEFTGIAIRNNCVALASTAGDRVLAGRAVQRTLRLVRGDISPRGQKTRVARLRSAISLFGPGQVSVRGTSLTEVLHAPEDVVRRPLREFASLRAEVQRVGGSPPKVRLRSPLEEKDFSLEASEDLACQLGRLLYRPVEIDAEVERDAAGVIETGKLLGFQPVEVPPPGTSPWDAWRAWHKGAEA